MESNSEKGKLERLNNFLNNAQFYNQSREYDLDRIIYSFILIRIGKIKI